MSELEEFENWIETLSEERKMIIVEGESDKKALENMGLIHVIALARQQLDFFVEKLKEKKVILLMDYDIHGKKLTKELVRLLERRRIKYELKYWKLLPKLKIVHIEGLDSRYIRLKTKLKNKV